MSLLLLALLALPQDDELKKELESMSLADVRKLYYLEWGRTGFADLKLQLDGKKGSPRAPVSEEQRQFIAEAVKQADEIFKEAKAATVVERLIRSKNPIVFKVGTKMAGKGGYEEVLPVLKEVDEAEARRVAAVIKSRAEPEKDELPVAEQREKGLAAARAALHELKEGKSRQGLVTLRGLCAAYVGEDVAAWERWVESNERYIGVESALGLLYVDVEAKAAGVAWTEWIAMSKEARARKLEGIAVPPSGKVKTVVLEAFADSAWLHGTGVTGAGDIDAESRSLPSWLFLQRKTAADRARVGCRGGHLAGAGRGSREGRQDAVRAIRIQGAGRGVPGAGLVLGQRRCKARDPSVRRLGAHPPPRPRRGGSSE
jgi:hypothetical protein